MQPKCCTLQEHQVPSTPRIEHESSLARRSWTQVLLTTHWRSPSSNPRQTTRQKKKNLDWLEPHTASQLNQMVFENFVLPNTRILLPTNFFGYSPRVPTAFSSFPSEDTSQGKHHCLKIRLHNNRIEKCAWTSPGSTTILVESTPSCLSIQNFSKLEPVLPRKDLIGSSHQQNPRTAPNVCSSSQISIVLLVVLLF